MAPPYADGLAPCFQMAAHVGGHMTAKENLHSQASLWSISPPAVSTASHTHAFRERKVADIYLKQRRQVGIDLFCTPQFAKAWAVLATQGQHKVLFRDPTVCARPRQP